QRAVGRVLEVERDALLAAIDECEVERAAVEEGAERARRITAAAALDLDHARTELAEQHGAERTGENARQVEDEDPVERSCAVGPRAAVSPPAPGASTGR